MTTTHEEIVDFLLKQENWPKNVYLTAEEHQRPGFHACNCNGYKIKYSKPIGNFKTATCGGNKHVCVYCNTLINGCTNSTCVERNPSGRYELFYYHDSCHKAVLKMYKRKLNLTDSDKNNLKLFEKLTAKPVKSYTCKDCAEAKFQSQNGETSCDNNTTANYQPGE